MMTQRERLMARLACAIAALALCGFAGRQYFGDPSGRNPGDPQFAKSQTECLRVRDLAVPAADAPSPATAAGLQGCSSEALYYGVGVKADPVKARQCAVLELRDPQKQNLPFAGAGMLMTIYANGRGAKKDLDLATHMACATWDAPVDSNTLVLALQARKTNKSNEPFDYCRDVEQGYSNVSMAICAEFERRQADAIRNARFAAIMAGWTPDERTAYAAVANARDAFLALRQNDERNDNVMDRSAPSYFQMELFDQQKTLLEKLTAGHGPVANAGQRRVADRELNAFYGQLIAALPEQGQIQIDRTGVRQTQRAWITYRDAWLTFVARKWPGASGDGLATFLTRKRLGDLHCDAYRNGDERFEQECG